MNLDSAVFYTNDIPRIRKFYEEIVGLTFDYQDGERYVSFIFPNGARLGINRSKLKREKPGAQTVFISVKNCKKEYEKYTSRDYKIYEAYGEFYWGKYFAILDPDGNKIGFVER